MVLLRPMGGDPLPILSDAVPLGHRAGGDERILRGRPTARAAAQVAASGSYSRGLLALNGKLAARACVAAAFAARSSDEESDGRGFAGPPTVARLCRWSPERTWVGRRRSCLAMYLNPRGRHARVTDTGARCWPGNPKPHHGPEARACTSARVARRHRLAPSPRRLSAFGQVHDGFCCTLPCTARAAGPRRNSATPRKMNVG